MREETQSAGIGLVVLCYIIIHRVVAARAKRTYLVAAEFSKRYDDDDDDGGGARERDRQRECLMCLMKRTAAERRKLPVKSGLP